MSKAEILADMLEKNDAYVKDWHNKEKWEAYVDAWKKWRAVKGEN